MKVNLDKICTTAGTQTRNGTSAQTVDSYAGLMQDGVEFPPVVLFDDGKKYYLACGFHRYAARKKLGAIDIDAEIRKGSLRDAILYSMTANAAHGLQLSVAERRSNIEKMLDDMEWSEWSDREIAKHCGASHTLVSNMRKERAGTKAAPAKPGKQKPVEILPDEVPEESEKDVLIETLTRSVEDLEAKLAVATLPEGERESGAEYIEELRQENAQLRRELDAVTKSRDLLQAENAQLKKQVAMQNKKLKAVAA